MKRLLLLATAMLLSTFAMAQFTRPLPRIHIYPEHSDQAIPGVPTRFHLILTGTQGQKAEVHFQDQTIPLIQDHTILTVREDNLEFNGHTAITQDYQGSIKFLEGGIGTLPFTFQVHYQLPRLTVGRPKLPALYRNCLNILPLSDLPQLHDTLQWALRIHDIPHSAGMPHEFTYFDDTPWDYNNYILPSYPTPPDTVWWFQYPPSPVCAIIPHGLEAYLTAYIKSPTTQSIQSSTSRPFYTISPPPPTIHLLHTQPDTTQTYHYKRQDYIYIHILPDPHFANTMPQEIRYLLPAAQFIYTESDLPTFPFTMPLTLSDAGPNRFFIDLRQADLPQDLHTLTLQLFDPNRLNALGDTFPAMLPPSARTFKLTLDH